MYLTKLLWPFSFLLFFSCSNLFYHPSKNTYLLPEFFGIEYESFHFKSQDQTKLHGWKLKAIDDRPQYTVIFFHGNAENISSHFITLAWLTRHDFQILNFDYRGYGKSHGKPSPKGLYQDSLSALQEAWKWHKKSQTKKFIVYAQSLGGAVAAKAIHDFSHKDDIDLLVLESSFSSYKKVAVDVLKNSVVTWIFHPLGYVLVPDKFATTKVLPQLPGFAKLIIHGNEDTIVPFHHGQKIFELISPPKTFWKVSGGLHTNTFFHHGRKYRKKFLDYIKKHVEK